MTARSFSIRVENDQALTAKARVLLDALVEHTSSGRRVVFTIDPQDDWWSFSSHQRGETTDRSTDLSEGHGRLELLDALMDILDIEVVEI